MMIIRDIVDLVNKEKRKTERERTLKCVAGCAVGMVAVAAAGVAVGMLFAPKSGKKMREDIKKKAADTVEAIRDKVHEKEEMVMDSVANAAKDVSNDVKDAHEKAKGVKKDM
jgi:gas vesicle protein